MAAWQVMDTIITGASRGIGRALALALASRHPRDRLVLVARSEPGLREVAQRVSERGGRAEVVPGDLSELASAQRLGEQLRDLVEPRATLVHNAGLWPAQRVLNGSHLEQAFVVNHLGPLALQAPLIAAERLARVLVVSAGLIALGRFDPARTPSGADFSKLRTYASTKLCFAIAMRRLATQHPELDVLVLHPGVVQTDLGALPGFVGRVLDLAKKRWERPEVCAERLARILARERWSTPGEARWLVEEHEKPWPASASKPEREREIREVSARLLQAAS